MVAAKEKTVSPNVDPIVNRMDNRFVGQRATTTTPSVVNRISGYDFTTRKFKKPPIGPTVKIHFIVLVENHQRPRKTIGENGLHLRRLHQAPEMSLYQGYFVPGRVDPEGTDFIAISDRQIKAKAFEFQFRGEIYEVWAEFIFFHYSLEYWTCPCGDDGSFAEGQQISRDEARFFNCIPIQTTELVADNRWKAPVWTLVKPFELWHIPVLIASIHYPADLPKNDRLVLSLVGGPDTVEEKWQDVLGLAKTYNFAEQRGSEFKNWKRSLYHPAQTNSNTFAYQVIRAANLNWYDLPGFHPSTKRRPSQNHYFPWIFSDGHPPVKR